MPEGLEIAAVPAREDPADVWIGAGGSLDEVPEGARVGTASLRRRAQLLAARPDLRVEELHGNVDTRLRKLAEGELDAIVLAAAGLRRLGPRGGDRLRDPGRRRWSRPRARAPWRCRSRIGDAETSEAATAINDLRAMRELTAERAVVALLDATCASPLGVHARVDGARDRDRGLRRPPRRQRVAARPPRGEAPRSRRWPAPNSPSACSPPAPASSSTARAEDADPAMSAAGRGSSTWSAPGPATRG